MKPKPLNTIAFVCHAYMSSPPPILEDLINWSEQHRIKVLLPEKMSINLKRPDLAASTNKMQKEADMLIVLGGDGAILEAARLFAGTKPAIAGINLGHLGFLTLDEPCKAMDVLEKIKTCNYRIENRAMLKTKVYRKKSNVFSGIALNDIVVQRAPKLRIINVSVSISGSLINTFHGDGLIVSTPTGSTAYSLSAGGPIVPPWVKAFILCPLNCHNLSARPVILSNKEVVKATLSSKYSKVELVLDGQVSFPLEDGDEVEITEAPQKAKIVALKSRNFFEVLRIKMNWR